MLILRLFLLLLLLLAQIALDSLDLQLLLLNSVCELEHVRKVSLLYLSVENQLSLPDQVLEAGVSLNYLLTTKGICELLDSYVVLIFLFKLIKKVLEVLLHLSFVLDDLLFDQLFVVDENLGQQKIAEQEDSDQEERPKVEQGKATLLEERHLHVRVVRHCE